MPNFIKQSKLKREYQLDPAKTVRWISEAIEAKEIRPDQFSIQDLFISLIENGQEMFNELRHGTLGPRQLHLLEAANAVSTADFSNITGQLLITRVLERYQDPEFLWPELCETIPTVFQDGEKIPGIGRLGDKAETVEEGMAYPTVGLNEVYLQTVPLVKKGLIVPVTREAILADRTGILLREAGEGGHALGILKEKSVMDVATGQVNNYKRNGVATNTYLTSGAYVNSQTGNALDTSGNEWRAIEKGDLLFDALTDPSTGEPIGGQTKEILVPTALMRTANRIVGATEVQTVDMRANAGTVRTTGGNPYGGKGLRVLSNQYVKARTSSATQWFQSSAGFKRAFAWMQAWDIESIAAAANNEAEFTQDIMFRVKGTYKGVAQSLEPRYVCKNDT